MSCCTNYNYFLAGFEGLGVGFAVVVFGLRIERVSRFGILGVCVGLAGLSLITITSLISTSQTLTGGDVLVSLIRLKF